MHRTSTALTPRGKKERLRQFVAAEQEQHATRLGASPPDPADVPDVPDAIASALEKAIAHAEQNPLDEGNGEALGKVMMEALGASTGKKINIQAGHHAYVSGRTLTIRPDTERSRSEAPALEPPSKLTGAASNAIAPVVNATDNTAPDAVTLTAPVGPAALPPTATNSSEGQAATAVAAEEQVHYGFMCDKSGMSPIVGKRYRARGLPEYVT